MVVLELASSTGSSRGRSSKTTKKSLFEGAGSSKCWFWNWPAARAAAGAGVPKPPKNRFLKAREAQNAGFGTSSTGSSRGRSAFCWPAARAAAGAGVPKPPKNRFLKAREAQNAGFGTGQQHGQQQGQEFQNHQKIAF